MNWICAEIVGRHELGLFKNNGAPFNEYDMLGHPKQACIGII